MATCPECGASSRTDPTFSVERTFTPTTLGRLQISAGEREIDMVQTLVLRHDRCGWAVSGHLDETSGEFVALGPRTTDHKEREE